MVNTARIEMWEIVVNYFDRSLLHGLVRFLGPAVAKQPANRFSGIVLQHYATSPSQLDVYILPLLIAGQLGWKNLPGVPSRETNSGLPYSKPTHYQLSYAAPCD
jgi:hypothetical protein